jgi:hypothetical protein
MSFSLGISQAVACPASFARSTVRKTNHYYECYSFCPVSLSSSSYSFSRTRTRSGSSRETGIICSYSMLLSRGTRSAKQIIIMNATLSARCPCLLPRTRFLVLVLGLDHRVRQPFAFNLQIFSTVLPVVNALDLAFLLNSQFCILNTDKY